MTSTVGYCPPSAVPRPVVTGRTVYKEPGVLQPLSLRRNFGWIISAGCVRAVSRWGIVVVLARLGSLEMIGQVALAYAVCAPVSGLMNLGLRVALVTDARDEYPFGDYLGLRLATAAIALLVVVAVTLAMGCETQLALVILVVGLGNVLDSISDLFHGLLQRYERMDRIATALMIRGPLNLILLATGVYLTGNILWGVIGFPLAWAATLFACDVPNGAGILRARRRSAPGRSDPGAKVGIGELNELKPRWNAPALFRLIRLGLPLGIGALLVMLIANIPRYLIDYYLGKDALGVFALLACLALVGTMVINAIGQSASPRLARYYAEGSAAAFRRLLGKLLGLALCVGGGVVLLMVLLGGPVLHLLYGRQFAQYADLAVYLMIASAMMYFNGPLSRAIEAMRRFKVNTAIRATSVLVLLVLLPGLIGAYGLEGAAGAIAISAAVSVLMYAVAAHRGIRRLETNRLLGC